jgi:hypothetical protein
MKRCLMLFIMLLTLNCHASTYMTEDAKVKKWAIDTIIDTFTINKQNYRTKAHEFRQFYSPHALMAIKTFAKDYITEIHQGQAAFIPVVLNNPGPKLLSKGKYGRFYYWRIFVPIAFEGTNKQIYFTLVVVKGMHFNNQHSPYVIQSLDFRQERGY